jgi:hypothetical protein
VIKKQYRTSLVLLFPQKKDGMVYISQQAPSSTFSAVPLPTIVNGRCNAGFLHWWNGCPIPLYMKMVSKRPPNSFLKDEDKKFDQHHQPTIVGWAWSLVL